MDETKVLKNYFLLFTDLINLIEETNKRCVSKNTSHYFINNVNFFNKSFTVLICAYLESYLKDVGMLIIEEMNYRLKNNPVPHNLIKWYLNINKQFKTSETKYEFLKININKKDIDNEISADIGRTINLFQKLGIDLNTNSEFNNYKDIIGSIVRKRNNIIHHNDEASDISFDDIIENINLIKEYIIIIDKEVINHISYSNERTIAPE
ncbi:MAG: hypothetical protein FFODKBPE_00141 [Candidatus Argoarchaeum ethanivorans]|uniref:RiboL-PSP-HEPN domain-containing protein n=1 Tax=Candidatus Argoarchaeum ethanivorans TaxID=2608793 RepID=A0A811T6X3_9EURY|nr:MAG: hypothetical protein FFODKBPE_00141 [Candidatus Argoarchaeum ethanivorans]